MDGRIGSVAITYVRKMLDSVKGMKALMLDAETMGIFSSVMGLTEILEEEVFLTSQLGKDVESKSDVGHLAAIVFIRPTEENKDLLETELASPRYKEYHLFFTNILPKGAGWLSTLAQADRYERIFQVQEFFLDYIAVNSDLAILDLPRTTCLYRERNSWTEDDRRIYNRNLEGCISLLLSLKRRPTIRYQASSTLCRTMMRDIHNVIKEENELFGWSQSSQEPVLLIMDRQKDPITPLLCQWTYQAMIHQFLGIKKGRVDCSSIPGVSKELRQVVLNTFEDDFFRQSQNKNYGEYLQDVKGLVDKFQKLSKTHKNINSIEQMQKFVDNYPEFMKSKGEVSKHITLMMEMSRLVNENKIMAVSELEQEIVCKFEANEHFQELMGIIRDHKIGFEDKLRLGIIYALRYEGTKGANNLEKIRNELRTRANSQSDVGRVHLIDVVLRKVGKNARGGTKLFKNDGTWSMDSLRSVVSSNLQGAENVFTQHKTPLEQYIDDLLANRLKIDDFPIAGDGLSRKQPTDLIIFILGGVTFEEAVMVAKKNRSQRQTRLVLAGSYVHNAQTYLEDIAMGSNTIGIPVRGSQPFEVGFEYN